jgi:hypothetical protein
MNGGGVHIRRDRERERKEKYIGQTYYHEG